eukprot:COSAG03_NODE_51_length_16288_cov_69.544691_2_plen_214_part_00
MSEIDTALRQPTQLAGATVQDVGTITAAEPQEPVTTRVVVATFSEQNSAAASVRGTVTFTQTDADADVEIQIALTGLEHGGQDGNGWHVHEWPVTGQDCGPDSVSGHYNPAAQCVEAASVSVDADREACAAVTALETADACTRVLTSSTADADETQACVYTAADPEMGELSQHLGDLVNPSDTRTVTDSYVTLFGEHSIVGRSIVIHKADSSR